MTATAIITARTAAATQVIAIAVGVTANYAAHDLEPDEAITVQVPDAAGTYADLYYTLANGLPIKAELTANRNTIALTGPVDARFNKPITDAAVELTEYT